MPESPVITDAPAVAFSSRTLARREAESGSTPERAETTPTPSSPNGERDAGEAGDSKSSPSKASSPMDAIGTDMDGYEVVAALRCKTTGDVWYARVDKEFRRKHYYNPVTKDREDSKWPSWKTIKDPNAHDVTSDSESGSDDGRDEGESFVSSTNGRRYSKYYDKLREEYYYVDEETNETTWDHPDGEAMEFMQRFVPAAFTSAAQAVAPTFNAVAERTVTHEEHVELKLAKMLLVEEKWFEKQPASKNVPGRPEVFEGVYGERERFWDPEADTYSVDNNEGSEHGMEIFEEAYEAEDALERYTSAVDLATPEDMRPMNVARDYFTNLLLIMFEMTEEEQDFAFAEKRATLNTRGVQKFTHKGHRVVGVRRLSLEKAPEIADEIQFEKSRANASAKLSIKRLQFDPDTPENVKSLFYRRLAAPMGGMFRAATILERVDTGSDRPHFGGAGSSIESDNASETSSTAIANAPKKVATAGVGDEHASDRLDFDASSSGSDNAADDEKQRSKPPKRRGLFGKLFASSESKRERREAKKNAEQERKNAEQERKDEQDLLASGFVAPWTRDPESVRFLRKPDTFDETTLPTSLREVERVK